MDTLLSLFLPVPQLFMKQVAVEMKEDPTGLVIQRNAKLGAPGTGRTSPFLIPPIRIGLTRKE